MSEIVFLAEQVADGGFTARAVGHAIFTEADSAAGLRAAVRDAVRCHFEDDERRPRSIRLRFLPGDSA